MKTFAQAQKDKLESRYTSDTMPDVDGTTIKGAKAILSSRGGKKAAKHALASLYKASVDFREGWLVTAQINAPLRVLQALVCTGLIEQNDNAAEFPMTESQYAFNQGRSHVWRYRLTDFGKQIAKERLNA